ncbi:unnamed protein product [Cuscuta campestris]|uniref:Uncharacterized protein n=1 Tax=Cuscuta campestris TaxID=132261 RepID=A0A484M7F3_9ASTE|nr:unnamed protein product [Cuscuta campestris]
MGSVEVLRPQDPLQNRFNRRNASFVKTATKSKVNSSSNPNPNPNRGSGRVDRRKRRLQNRSTDSGRDGGVSTSSSPPGKKSTASNLFLGQVRILKRGEVLTDLASLNEDSKRVDEKGGEKSPVEDFVLSTVARLGPEPERMPKELRFCNFFAGSACITSPPPSSLPLPAFFKKKNILGESKDDATGDLRRLLRIDLY